MEAREGGYDAVLVFVEGNVGAWVGGVRWDNNVDRLAVSYDMTRGIDSFDKAQQRRER